MTDQDPRTPTPQEQALYDAMTGGDWDTIQTIIDNSKQDQTVDETTGLTPSQQCDLDYQAAWQHYQTDHEAPEQERETATVEHVETENTQAPDPPPVEAPPNE